ncbi:MAG: hypothetical protein IKC56_00340, partial [Clostridia bacterium]|nr:hypothetical protein [Clostridia bacterium]
MRTDSLYIGNTGIRVSQLLSGLLVLGGLIGATVILYLRKKKGSQPKTELEKTVTAVGEASPSETDSLDSSSK